MSQMVLVRRKMIKYFDGVGNVSCQCVTWKGTFEGIVLHFGKL